LRLASRLKQALAHDAFKIFMRRLSIWVITIVAACALWTSFQLDEPVRLTVIQSQGKEWKKTDDFRFITGVRRFGDWPWLMLSGAIGMAISWKLRNRDWIRIIIAAMIACSLAGIIANTSRVTTGRTRLRKSLAIPEGFYGAWRGGRLTVGDPPLNSFPSGHAATAFGFAGVILFARSWLGIGAIALASLIAWSSIMVGTHHLSDVVVSICVSLVLAWWTLKWTQKYGDAFARNAWMRLETLKGKFGQR
jgi:membrane-associated phospholipid phosphatase